jgi:hypothetical protein
VNTLLKDVDMPSLNEEFTQLLKKIGDLENYKELFRTHISPDFLKLTIDIPHDLLKIIYKLFLPFYLRLGRCRHYDEQVANRFWEKRAKIKTTFEKVESKHKNQLLKKQLLKKLNQNAK